MTLNVSRQTLRASVPIGLAHVLLAGWFWVAAGFSLSFLPGQVTGIVDLGFILWFSSIPLGAVILGVVSYALWLERRVFSPLAVVWGLLLLTGGWTLFDASQSQLPRPPTFSLLFYYLAFWVVVLFIALGAGALEQGLRR